MKEINIIHKGNIMPLLFMISVVVVWIYSVRYYTLWYQQIPFGVLLAFILTGTLIYGIKVEQKESE